MGKATFILDRPDFERMLTVLPPSEDRDRLADRLRDARSAYMDHRARRPRIVADLEAIGRQIAEQPDDVKLGSKAAALSAELAVYPTLLEEKTRRYAKALVAWAGTTWLAFSRISNEAADVINEAAPEWHDLVRRADRLHSNSPEFRANQEAIEVHRAKMAPYYTTVKTCRSGMGAVEAALSFGIGATVVHGRPQHGDVERFVRTVSSADRAA